MGTTTKYIKDRYKYLSIGVPSSMGALFFLTIVGYIYGLVDGRAVTASPFLGGGLSLGYWYIYELSRLGKQNKSLSEKFQFQSTRNMMLSVDGSDDFIFYEKGMPMPITKPKLEQFCDIGCKRQRTFYEDKQTMLETRTGFSRLSVNQVWSESVFNRRGFLTAETRGCKQVLTATGTFHSWRQGSAGLSHYLDPGQVVETSERRWRKMFEKTQTSSNFMKLLRTSTS